MLRKNLAFLALTVGFLMCALSSHAQSTVRTYYVSPIQVSGLSSLRSQFPRAVQNNLYMTLFYGIGRRSSLTNQGDQILLREVKAKKTLAFTSDVMNFPEIYLKRSSVFVSFNILVFVVHVGPDFSWLNANGIAPEGQILTEQHQYLAVDSLTQPEFQSLSEKQNPTAGQAVKYSFGAGVLDSL